MIGIDQGGKDIQIEERYMKPTAEYPEGSWLHKIGGEVQVATGYYATIYPDKPSPYWHQGPPFVVIDTADWEWERKAMDQVEAAAKAKEVFGDEGYVYDRDRTPRCGSYKNFPRFYVGSGSRHYGNGNTWEEAFKNVKRFREQDEI